MLSCSNALVAAIEKEKAVYEVVAPKIGGVTFSDGTKLAAKQKIDGGPSVLFDVVAILASKDGAALLAGDATAKDFVSDAFAHCKFIGYTREAEALFVKAGIAEDLDAGCILLEGKARRRHVLQSMPAATALGQGSKGRPRRKSIMHRVFTRRSNAPSRPAVCLVARFFKFGPLDAHFRLPTSNTAGRRIGSGGTWRGVGLPRRRSSCPDRFTWRIWI